MKIKRSFDLDFKGEFGTKNRDVKYFKTEFLLYILSKTQNG